MLLFIKSLMEHDWSRLQNLSIILVVIYTGVLIAVIIDLMFGVSRAKKLGVVRTSYGFRRTITKATTYYALLMLLTIADVIASMWFSLPFFTAVGGIGIIGVEWRSVFEKTKDANKSIEDIPKVLVEIIKNKDNIQEIINFLDSNKKVDIENQQNKKEE